MKAIDMKKYILTLLVIIIALSSVACSKTKEVSEEQILSDITDNEYTILEYGLEIDSYEIIKRQTDVEMNYDRVWVEIVASNDDFSYGAQIELLYGLYDNGWVINECNTNDSNYRALKECDKSLAENAILADNPQYSLEYVSNESEDANNTLFFYYGIDKVNKVITTKHEIIVSCKYSPHTGWYVDYCDMDLVEETWDMCGTYQAKNENVNLSLRISKFDVDVQNNKIYVQFDYSFTSYMGHDDLWGGPSMQQNQVYSSSVETELIYNNGGASYILEDIAHVYFCAQNGVESEPETGVEVTIDSDYVATYGSYWLIKQ